MESTPSLPSIAWRRSTNERAGSREVCTVTIISQSTIAGTGRIRFSTIAAHRSTSSSARSSTSVCGYSL